MPKLSKNDASDAITLEGYEGRRGELGLTRSVLRP
jgi:hypothetical protein